MAQLEGIHIQNFRSLKDVRLGKTTDSATVQPLPTMFTIIGPNGAGKSALLDAFGFLGDCLHFGVEEACDKFQRGGFNGLRTKGSEGPIKFELCYREAQNTQPINYTLHIDSDHDGHVVVVHERLTQRRKGQTEGLPLAFFEFNRGAGFAWTGESTQEAEGTHM